MRVGASVVAATSAAGTSSVNTMSGSSFSTAVRNEGKAAFDGACVRTSSATRVERAAGKCM